MAKPKPIYPKDKKTHAKISNAQEQMLDICQKAFGKSRSEIMRMAIENLYYSLNDDTDEKYFHQIYKKAEAVNLKIGDIKYVKIGYASIYQDYSIRQSVTIPKVLYKDSYVIKNEDDFTGKAAKKETLGLYVYSDMNKELMFGQISNLYANDERLSEFPIFGPGMDIEFAMIFEYNEGIKSEKYLAGTKGRYFYYNVWIQKSIYDILENLKDEITNDTLQYVAIGRPWNRRISDHIFDKFDKYYIKRDKEIE